MAIKMNAGRQETISARLKISLGTGNDVEIQGTYPAISLPEGAVVVGGTVTVTDASTAGATLTLGSYATNVSLAATGVTDVTITGLEEASAVVLDAVIGGADPAAAGEVVINLEYIVDGRAAFSQG